MTHTARWTDLAEWRGPTPNHGGPMQEWRGLVLHIAQGYYEGTISWQKDPANKVSSHFVVDFDGKTGQVVETGVTAWTQIEGNGHWLSAEFAGFIPGALTDSQLDAAARLLARMHRDYGVPLKVAADPSDRGLAHHSLGAEHGVNWGHPDCPGSHIIAQQPEIVRRATAIIEGDDMPTAEENANELMSGLREDKGNKGWTGKVGITAGTDLGGGADAARAGLDQARGNGSSLTEVKTSLARVEGDLAELKAMVAALAPPAAG